MTYTLILLGTMVRRQAILMRRYSFNTVMQLGTVYMFFLLAFTGAKSLTGTSATFGDTAGGLVVGFAMWTLVTIAFTDFANSLAAEAAQGTLEQLSMSPAGLTRVLLCRAFGSLSLQVLTTAALLLLMMLTTGQWLHLDLVSVLPLLLLTVMGVMGIGLTVGGLTVLFKQTQSIFGVLQIVFLALIALPVDTPGLRMLPLSWGTHLISRVMVQGTPLWRIPAADLLLLAANTAVYMGAGMLVFRFCEARARSRGLLGQY